MALASWTTQQILDQLVSGYSWSGSTITYAFPTSSAGTYGSTEAAGFQSLNATQQSYAKIALATWDDLIAPNFVQTTSTSSNIEFGMSTTGVQYAHTYYPTVGTVWFNSTYADLTSPQIGQHGFLTYVHELGHALGLDHMGNYNGTGTWTPSSYEDSTVYSVMSYFGPSWGSGSGAGEGLVAWADWVGADGRLYSPQTPMLNDIMAIQKIYGADTTTRTGDTVYGFGSNVTGQNSSIYDFSANRNPILTVYDAGGNDTLNLSGWSTSSTVNLAPGSFSSCNSMTNNIAIAYSTNIENVICGAGADSITGNTLANAIDGGAGNDSIYGLGGDDALTGGSGNDYIDGGAGADWAFFSGTIDSYTCTYNAGNQSFTITGTLTGIDTVLGVEYFGFAGSVTRTAAELSGASQPAPSIVSLTGSTLSQAEGNTGSTVYTFTATLDAAAAAAQTVNWSLAGSGTHPTDGADFTGATSGTLSFAAGETQKVFSVAVAGDLLAEDSETFTVSLSAPSSGLLLGTASATGTITNDDAAQGVTLSGDAYANTLTGTVGDDKLYGFAGTDTLNGGSGNDVLDGGTGGDQLNGGAGNDTYVVDNISDVVTEALSAGADQVLASVSYKLASNVENLTLTGSSALSGTGNELANVLVGNSGNNVLNGGAGLDSFRGGYGSDTYVLDQQGELATITEGSAAGADTIQIAYSNASTTAISVSLGGANLTAVENLTVTGTGLFNVVGNGLDNVLVGNASANRLEGGDGNDRLDGKGGADVLVAGVGNDVLIGGTGRDFLTGGTGSDVFDFNALSEMGTTSTTWDVINDFTTGSDRIDLSTLDANVATTGDDAFSAVLLGAGATFTAAGQLKLSAGVLYGNTDADSTAEFAIQLTNVTSLAVADLVL